MIELNEYMQESKKRRSELKRLAERISNRTSFDESIQNSKIAEEFNTFPSPSPQGLKNFEFQINTQLRKIFTPGICEEEPKKNKFLSHLSMNDTIRSTYSRNAKILKKKQLIMLPRDHFFQQFKIPNKILKNKNLSASPENLPQKKQSFSNKEKNKIFKESLFFPVLSTVGTHEERCKIYKLK